MFYCLAAIPASNTNIDISASINEVIDHFFQKDSMRADKRIYLTEEECRAVMNSTSPPLKLFEFTTPRGVAILLKFFGRLGGVTGDMLFLWHDNPHERFVTSYRLGAEPIAGYIHLFPRIEACGSVAHNVINAHHFIIPNQSEYSPAGIFLHKDVTPSGEGHRFKQLPVQREILRVLRGDSNRRLGEIRRSYLQSVIDKLPLDTLIAGVGVQAHRLIGTFDING